MISQRMKNQTILFCCSKFNYFFFVSCSISFSISIMRKIILCFKSFINKKDCKKNNKNEKKTIFSHWIDVKTNEIKKINNEFDNHIRMSKIKNTFLTCLKIYKNWKEFELFEFYETFVMITQMNIRSWFFLTIIRNNDEMKIRFHLRESFIKKLFIRKNQKKSIIIWIIKF